VNADWVRLWHLVNKVEAATGRYYIDEVGLSVVDPTEPPGDGGYRVSPVNATMFARTGGDGVHFSLLPSDAVVMTVPMAFEAPNHVVGADIREFLGLGCRLGYYSLDSLGYSWGRPRLIPQLHRGGGPAELLQPLIDEFGLTPWPDVERRLDELAATYAGTIALDKRR
jgi:hypothetical protein